MVLAPSERRGGGGRGETLGHFGPPLCSCPLSSLGPPGQKAALGVLLTLRVFIRHPGVFSANPLPPPKKKQDTVRQQSLMVLQTLSVDTGFVLKSLSDSASLCLKDKTTD